MTKVELLQKIWPQEIKAKDYALSLELSDAVGRAWSTGDLSEPYYKAPEPLDVLPYPTPSSAYVATIKEVRRSKKKTKRPTVAQRILSGIKDGASRPSVLATLAGVSRNHANTELSLMKKKGLVKSRRVGGRTEYEAK